MGKSRERKKSIIFTSYSPGAKKLQFPGKKLGRAAKTTSSVSIGSIWISRKEDLREKYFIFFWTMKERNFIFSSKTFRPTCSKKGFYVSIGTFWRKEILINLHFFNSFELWTKKTWPFVKTYWRNYQNCNLRNRRTSLRKKIFWKNCGL